MKNNLLTIFKEICPYCHERLIPEQDSFFTIKSCPKGHYKIQTHPLLGIQIEYHPEEQAQRVH